MENNATKDELTGLITYPYFEEVLKQEVIRSNRYSKNFSIVRFDIDNFKTINDNYGFDFGNIILKQFADLFKDTTRGSDVISRFEAENFVVMLPEVDTSDAGIFAERLRKKIENYADFGDDTNKVKITASIGIVTYKRKQEMELQQLLHLLDTAVYQAKQDGRNCIVPYTAFLPSEEETSSFL